VSSAIQPYLYGLSGLQLEVGNCENFFMMSSKFLKA